jgi:peptide chain release factor subunit 1
MELNNEKKYEFKTALDRVKELQGKGTELISLYVPPGRQISDVSNYLKGEYSQSSNIKSSSTRKNVQSAISSILARLRTYKRTPENGIVFFIGHRKVGADQTRMIQFVLEPPDPVPTFIYRCDSQFYTEPLDGMLLDKSIYGLLLLDRREATIGMLRGKRIELIKNIESQVPSKHRMGGQSARRFERLIEIAAHEFFKKVADLMIDAFLNEKGLEGILIGGPGPTKDFFIKEGYLHHELQKKVLETYDTGYTDEYGLKELVDKAKDTLSDIDLMREKRLVQKLLDEIRKAEGGLAAYGESQVKEALQIGAVDSLLVSEEMKRTKVDWKCPKCGFEKEVIVTTTPDELVCEKCGTEMDLVAEIDLVKELFKIAEGVSTKVELISGDSEEGELLIKAFGGLAALLRFPIAHRGS